MKAKYLRKLRKRISSFDKYIIRQSAGLFGDFFGDNSLGLIMDDYYVMADSYELALKRFFIKYERKFKRKNDNYTIHPTETTERWGRIMVENQRTKFIKFYR
jgi:hypothetical protein